jgi:hypothetical protein
VRALEPGGRSYPELAAAVGWDLIAVTSACTAGFEHAVAGWMSVRMQIVAVMVLADPIAPALKAVDGSSCAEAI